MPCDAGDVLLPGTPVVIYNGETAAALLPCTARSEPWTPSASERTLFGLTGGSADRLVRVDTSVATWREVPALGGSPLFAARFHAKYRPASLRVPNDAAYEADTGQWLSAEQYRQVCDHPILLGSHPVATPGGSRYSRPSSCNSSLGGNSGRDNKHGNNKALNFAAATKPACECVIDGANILEMTRVGRRPGVLSLKGAVEAAKRRGFVPRVLLPEFFFDTAHGSTDADVAALVEMEESNILERLHDADYQGEDPSEREAFMCQQLQSPAPARRFLLTNKAVPACAYTAHRVEEASPMWIARHVARCYESRGNMHILLPPLFNDQQTTSSERRRARRKRLRETTAGQQQQEEEAEGEGASAQSQGDSASKKVTATSASSSSSSTPSSPKDKPPRPPSRWSKIPLISITAGPLPEAIPLEELLPIFRVFGNLSSHQCVSRKAILLRYAVPDEKNSEQGRRLDSLVRLRHADLGFKKPLVFRRVHNDSQWHYVATDDSDEHGPVSTEQVIKLVEAGKLQCGSAVVHETLDGSEVSESAYERLEETCLAAFLPSESASSSRATSPLPSMSSLSSASSSASSSANADTGVDGDASATADADADAEDPAAAAEAKASSLRRMEALRASLSSRAKAKRQQHIKQRSKKDRMELRKVLQERMMQMQIRMREMRRLRASASSSASSAASSASSSSSSAFSLVVGGHASRRNRAIGRVPFAPWMVHHEQNVDAGAVAAPSLRQELLFLSQWCRLSEIERTARTRFLDEVTAFLQDYTFPDSGPGANRTLAGAPVQFGSSISGLDTFLSDIDLLVTTMIPPTPGKGQNGAAPDFISIGGAEHRGTGRAGNNTVRDVLQLAAAIRTQPGVKSCRSVASASVPVIKVTGRAVLEAPEEDASDKDGEEEAGVRENDEAGADDDDEVDDDDEEEVDDDDDDDDDSSGDSGGSDSDGSDSDSDEDESDDEVGDFTMDIVLVEPSRFQEIKIDVSSVSARLRAASENYPLLTPLVHFLRLLLHQHQLDELYGGGVNSFRVYCIVLSFLRVFTHAMADPTDVAEALLDLLEFYSAEGALGQDTTLEVPTLTSSGRGEAAAEPVTFHACFRISDVVHLFRTTHLILRQGKRSRGSLLLTCLHPEKLVAGTCRRL